MLPENNGEIRPVPQLLVNHPEGFLKGARLLRDLGYREINLNLGCPSGTVTAKKKGSGLLMYPEELDALLDRIFSDPMVTGGGDPGVCKDQDRKKFPGGMAAAHGDL